MERAEVLVLVREKADLLAVADLSTADSLVVVELVLDVEDAFGVELSEAEVAAATDLDDLADLVLAKLA